MRPNRRRLNMLRQIFTINITNNCLFILPCNFYMGKNGTKNVFINNENSYFTNKLDLLRYLIAVG